CSRKRAEKIAPGMSKNVEMGCRLYGNSAEGDEYEENRHAAPLGEKRKQLTE
ncbi:hypothetical protein DPMN_116112, partial [Dreissena polymorpha]